MSNHLKGILTVGLRRRRENNNINSESSKQDEQMKQFTAFLSTILFVIVVINTLIVSFISIWSDIDPIVLDKLQSTILLTVIVLILSFIINQSIE